MQITHVRLENFRKHECLDVDLTSGVNALIGPNGAGKSAILMAVKWVLFDYTPVTQAAMVRRGAKVAFAQVDFTHLGESWRVCRDTRSRYDIYRGPELEQVGTGKAESVAAIQLALGMGTDADLSKLCRDALAPDQGALVDPFRLSTTKRVEFWGPVLSLDEFRRAFGALKEPSKVLEGKEGQAQAAVEALRSTLYGLVEGVVSVETLEHDPQACYEASLSNLEEAQKELNEQEGALNIARQNLQALQQGVQRAAHLRESLARSRSTLAQVEAQLAQIDAQMRADVPRLVMLQEEQAGIKVDERAERDYQICYTEHAGLLARHDILKTAIATKEIELNALKQDHERAQKAAAELAETILPHLEQIGSEYEGYRQRWNTLHAWFERDSKGLEALIPGTSCPTCGAPMTEEAVEERRAHLMKVVGDEEREMAEINLKAGDLELKVKRAQRLQKEQEKIVAGDPGDKLIEMSTRLLAEDRRDHEILADRIMRLAEQLAVLGERRRKAQESGKRYMELIKEVSGLEARIRQNEAWKPAQEHERDVLLGDIQGLESELAIYPEGMDTQVEATTVRVQALESEVNVCTGRVHRLDYQSANLKRAQQVVSQIQARQQEAQDAAYARRLLERCRKAISDAGPQVATQVMERLSAVAQEYWAQMGKSTQLEWTGDFQVIVDGLNLEDYLSGGEQVAAALACRMAVARFQADLGWITLDEPTIHLDASARFGLAESLERLNLAQVIVVSHDDSFQAVASNVVNIE